MSNILFYFTGTGNGLLVTKAVAEELGDCKLMNIAEYQGEIISNADRIGFVFPVYYAGLPRIAHRFLKKLIMEGDPYLFSVAHCGGANGKIHKQIAKYLKKTNKRLHAGFTLAMPDNYIPIYRIIGDKEIKEMLSTAKIKISQFGETIRQKKEVPYESMGGPLFNALGSIMNYWFVSRVPGWDKNFNVADSCIGCEKCAKVCQVGNILMKDNRPIWKGHCEFCLACIHVCPKESINYKNATQDKGRYQAPKQW